MCGFCQIQNIGKEVDPPTPFDENDFNRFANDVWIGAINTDILPTGIYLKTATYLKDGVDLAPIVDEVLKTDLLNNIYVFSGAKTYQQTKALTSLLAVPEFQSNFYKFKEQAKTIFNVYNEDYLQAEYQTAKASARMGAEWKRIEADADVLPVLKYQTVGDGRVRPTHAALDNIVRPITDAFWKQYYPPNGWRCRCTVTQLAEDDEPLTDMAGFNPPDDVPPLFRMNVGQDGYIFKERGKDKHPYFDIAKGDKENAKVNWGLPIPQPSKPAPIIEVPNSIGLQKNRAKDIFEKNTGIIAKDVIVDDLLSLDDLTKVNNQIESLFNEYQIAKVYNTKIAPVIKYKSSLSYYGRITSSNDATFLDEINFGSKNDPSRVKFNAKFAPKSKVDEKNIQIATATHEFAHLITVDRQQIRDYIDERLKNFMPELRGIKNQYTREIRKLAKQSKESVELQSLYLGDYASTNINEFMAEAFTEYKLSSNPSKYAKIVGELIDKTFKKK